MTLMKIVLSVVLVIFLLSTFTVGCSDDDETQAAPTKTVEKTVEVPGPTVEVTREAVEPVKIGVLAALTGHFAEVGQSGVRGAMLAEDEINKLGGIESLGNAPIEIIVRDDQLETETIRQQCRYLIEEADVVAMSTGATTPEGRATAPLLTELMVAGLGNSFSDEFIEENREKGYDYWFNTYFLPSSGADEMCKVLKWAGEMAGKPITKIAILSNDSMYGKDTSSKYRTSAEVHGLEIVSDSDFPPGTADLTPFVAKAKASGAQALMLGGYGGDHLNIVRTMGTLDMHIPFIGPGSSVILNGMLDLGEAAEGALGIHSQAIDLAKPGVTELAEAFKDKYGVEMTADAGSIYLNIWIIKEAIELAGSRDPVAIKEALEKLDITSGPAVDNQPCDRIRFDDGQRIDIVMPIMQAQNGTFVTIYPENLAAGSLQTSMWEY